MQNSKRKARHKSMQKTGKLLKSQTTKKTRPDSAADQYQALYQEFHWQVPDYFNIAEVCCRRWADSRQAAILYENSAGQSSRTSYAELAVQVNQLSNCLQRQGIQRGDVVACILPQCPEMAISVLACLQLGAIFMPLSFLFGPEALSYRLQHSDARALILDQHGMQTFRGIQNECASIKTIIQVGVAEEQQQYDTLHWYPDVAAMETGYEMVQTRATDPAILIYTSGTTGAPKGALIPHSAMIGNLSGFVASQNWFPKKKDIFWSPADWAWTGGMMDALLPTLYFGKTIVGYQGRFTAETAFYLLEKYRITNSFLFPTALKMMMKAEPEPHKKYRLRLRAIMSAGEAVGATVFEWCQQALGVTPNEMFGQTEVNYIVGNSHKRWPARPGSMGRAYPGHQVAVIDDEGQPVAAGQTGEVALNRYDIQGHKDPIFFLGYWKNDAATRDKFSGDWCRTGDLAYQDQDGYLWYQGRADDMFKSAGYRIGPSEIENCLLGHPAVANVAVVPRPDRERGNLVKAYVVLAAGWQPGASLISQLQAHVRGKLAPYEYPKHIEFIDALPMTTTGKLQRRILRQREIELAASDEQGK